MLKLESIKHFEYGTYVVSGREESIMKFGSSDFARPFESPEGLKKLIAFRIRKLKESISNLEELNDYVDSIFEDKLTSI